MARTSRTASTSEYVLFSEFKVYFISSFAACRTKWRSCHTGDAYPRVDHREFLRTRRTPVSSVLSGKRLHTVDTYFSWYGWAAQAKAQFMVPIVGAGVFSFAMMGTL